MMLIFDTDGATLIAHQRLLVTSVSRQSALKPRSQHKPFNLDLPARSAACRPGKRLSPILSPSSMFHA
jgi:hypothetical protein